MMFEKFTSDNPFLIAEIGVNHEGSLDAAKLMIEELAEINVHCAKFQTYKAEKLAAKHSPSYWDLSNESIDSQYQLFKKYDMFDADDYRIISEHCQKLGVKFLSTPFDLDAVTLVDSLSTFFKVASADITNKPLLRSVASKGKPVVLSTGASNVTEIRDAVKVLESNGCPEICLLHCVLNYPTNYENAGLGFISVLKHEFPCLTIGYSDHTQPTDSHIVLLRALEFGASIIEKHYTFNKLLKGNDHYHAFDKRDLVGFTELLKLRRLVSNDVNVDRTAENEAKLNARRALYAVRDLEAGERIGAEDIIALRPALGISPMEVDKVVNSVVVKSIKSGEAIFWESIKLNE